jgi:hypothetical protein
MKFRANFYGGVPRGVDGSGVQASASAGVKTRVRPRRDRARAGVIRGRIRHPD